MEQRTYKEKLEQQLTKVKNKLEYLCKRGVNDKVVNQKYLNILKKLENEKKQNINQTSIFDEI